MGKRLAKAKDLAYFVIKKREVAPVHMGLLSMARADMDSCFSCSCGHPWKDHCYDCDILTCSACGTGPSLYEAHAHRMPIGRHFGR